jgi:hypothetical protein
MGFFKELFTPALKSENWERREKAVNKLTDQSVLADVAKNDRNGYVRLVAVKKLTDQSVLADVAKNDEDEYVRDVALGKLTDQSVLADIAQYEENWDVKKLAADKLSDVDLSMRIYCREIMKLVHKRDIDDKIISLIQVVLEKRPQFIRENWRVIRKVMQNKHDDSSRSEHYDTHGSHQDFEQATVLGSSDCTYDVTKSIHTDKYPYRQDLNELIKSFPAYLDNE